MKNYSVLHSGARQGWIKKRVSGIGLRSILAICFGSLAILLAACSGTGGGQPASQTPVNVNGFGIAGNHVHSFLGFPNNVLVLGTHYGLYRSVDDGQNWQAVPYGGANQLHQGLMTYSITSSPLNNQRLFLLTLKPLSTSEGTEGLYTSADQGKTWALMAKKSAIGYAYLAQAGNQSVKQVYIYIQSEGAAGLKMSMDDGAHFTQMSNLPFGSLQGLLPIPGQPGQLLAYSTSGVARSADGGEHWTLLPDFNGGAVYSMVTTGPGKPIYASGDAGIFVSQDGGKSFKQVYSQTSYAGLAVSPVDAQILYGKTGVAIYKSIDGGKTWKALPSIKGELEVLVPDVTDAARLLLSLSYPTQVYSFDQGSDAWHSLTPKA